VSGARASTETVAWWARAYGSRAAWAEEAARQAPRIIATSQAKCIGPALSDWVDTERARRSARTEQREDA